MLLHPVLDDPAVLVEAIADSTGAVAGSVRMHSALDVDVYRLTRSGDEPDLVVQVFGADVDRAVVETAARVLQDLDTTRFPAERCPTAMPVLSLDDHCTVFVTEYVEPIATPRPGFVLAWCSGLLGRLAVRPADNLPAGGGWHRLGATPSDEIDAALRLGGELGAAVAELTDAVAGADDGTGLPEALIHCDLTPANAVPQGEDRPVIIDWVGVGRGPRVWPLAFLLFVAGPRLAARGLERYSRSVVLTDEELQRLPGVMITRPSTLDLWSVAYERMSIETAINRLHVRRARIDAIAAAVGRGQA